MITQVRPRTGTYRWLPSNRWMLAGELVLLILFVPLAFEARRTPYFGWDLAVSHAVQRAASPALDLIMNAITGFGTLFVVPLAAVLALAWWMHHRWRSIMVLVTAGVTEVFELAVKLAVGRTRPSSDLVHLVSPFAIFRLEIQLFGAQRSFPSGHALRAMVFYGFLWYLAYRAMRRGGERTALLILLPLLILGIGLSRVYLGAHWPSDVLGGYLLGGLILLPLVWVYDEVRTGHP